MAQVGETVYGDFSQYERVDVRKGKVLKVTPTGIMKIDFGRTNVTTGEIWPYSFSPQGWERSPSSPWNRGRLITLEDYESKVVLSNIQKARLRASHSIATAAKVSLNDPKAVIAALEKALEDVKALDFLM